MRRGAQKPTEKISHLVIVRAPGLLPMLYRATELAEELGISPRVVRRWVGKGISHQRDSRGHIWIDGEEFAAWVDSQRRAPRGPRLGPGEGYCLRCRRAVRLSNPTRREDGRSPILRGTCPKCGATVNRGVRDGQSN